MSLEGESSGDVQRLAIYFREHPAALSESPESIANATGASIDTVRSLLNERPRDPRGAFRPNTDAIQDSIRAVVNGFDRLLKYPLLFVGVTFVIAALALWLTPGSASRSPSGEGFQFTLNQAIQVGVVGMTFLLHMACYFRVGMVRYALMGAGLLSASFYIVFSINLVNQPRMQEVGLGTLLALLALGSLVLGVMYAGLGIGASLLGAYRRLRREEAARHRRTRQELLHRLFEVEESLAAVSSQTAEQPRLIDLFRGVANRVWWYALGTGFAWGMLMVILTTLFPDLNPNQSGSNNSFVAPFVMLGITGATMATQILLSYLTGRPLRAILVSLVFVVGSTIANSLPIGQYGLRWLIENSAATATSAVLFGITGLFAGLGAMVEERAYVARRRGANAPEVLLSEMIELRRMLNRGEQHRCVMVVDAARSSVMKSKSDPLVAEWSFRAYQEFLARQVEMHRGRIHSTAGDGAVAAFDSADDAFECARSIQTNIVEFNRDVNRLKDPFRLRIGLHCGVVSGELDEVQFAAVIDIAAHIEAASQIGGIAVTASIAERLPDHRFAELNETIDEQRVLLALNPTLDPDDES